MPRHRLPLRLLLFSTLFYTLYTLRSYRRFQRHLSIRAITSSSFPLSYALALNTSVAASSEPPLDFPYATVFPATLLIPRIIHYIWFADLYPGRNASLDVQTNAHSPHRCRMFNPSPSWEYRTWDLPTAESFLSTHYPWFLPTWKSYPHPIQRVDALKYFVLLHFGGVYMDFDVACRRPLDPLLQFPSWFPEASPLGVNNDVMAARPGHPVMEALVQGLERGNRNWGVPWLTIFVSTGPMYVSGVLKGWFEGRGREAGDDRDAVFVLPRVYYSESHTFFGHRAGGSWHGKDVRVVLWVVNRPWVLLIMFGLLGVVAFVLRRRRWNRVGRAEEGGKVAV